MGCDIHIVAERRVNGVWETIPKGRLDFDRNYGAFGFLADVRNYSQVQPISQPRGLPPDISFDVETYYYWRADHSFSWLSVKELTEFDYDQEMEDRRIIIQISSSFWDGGGTAKPGEGVKTTYREFLGSQFFKFLEELKICGAERIVFGFDS